jgi:hypothetical protein
LKRQLQVLQPPSPLSLTTRTASRLLAGYSDSE